MSHSNAECGVIRALMSSAPAVCLWPTHCPIRSMGAVLINVGREEVAGGGALSYLCTVRATECTVSWE